MSDCGAPTDSCPNVDDPPQWPDRLSRKKTAQFLGKSEAAVRRLEALGRLISLTGKGKRALFALTSVQHLAGQLKAESRVTTGELDGLDAAKIETARAEKVTDMISAANSHSEEFFRLTVNAIHRLAELTSKIAEVSQRSADRENERLAKRVEHLEGERDAWLEVLDRGRRDEEAAADRRAKRDLLFETVTEGKVFAKAILAAKMMPGIGKTALQVGAIDSFLKTLSPEQNFEIMKSLTPEQQAMLMAIAASAEGKTPADAPSPATSDEKAA